MATRTDTSPSVKVASTTGLGSMLVALSGIGLVGYGLLFLIVNFTNFIELGLTPDLVGGTAQQIQQLNPLLYDYISHLQVALSGFIIALGVAVIWLAWAGIRSGQKWTLWAAFVTPVIAVAIALPLHFPFGLATIGHLGPIYLDAAILLAGTILAYREMPGN